MSPSSNFVSAMMTPRPSASRAAAEYAARQSSRARPASSAPTSAAAASKEMFSSWPVAAFVDGVNTGSGKRSRLDEAGGRAVRRASVPALRYSRQAEPAR